MLPQSLYHHVEIRDPVQDDVNMDAALRSDLDPVYVLAYFFSLLVLVSEVLQELLNVL